MSRVGLHEYKKLFIISEHKADVFPSSVPIEMTFELAFFLYIPIVSLCSVIFSPRVMTMKINNT